MSNQTIMLSDDLSVHATNWNLNLSRLSFLALKNDIHINSHLISESQLQYIPREQSLTALAHFIEYIQNCTEASELGISLKKPNQLIEFILKKMRLHTEQNLGYIEGGDIVEIYNSKHIQIFRNIEFFSVCTYTVFDILTKPWFELYERNIKMAQELLAMAENQIVNGRAPYLIQHPKHTFKEIMSPNRQIIEVQYKYLTPLFCQSTGACNAYLVSQTAKPLINVTNDVDQIRYL